MKINLKKISLVLSIIIALFTIVGGVYTFAGNFATDKRVDNVVVKHDKDMNNVEIRLAGALENVQQKIEAKHYQFMYDTINSDIYEVKRQIMRYPNDEILKEDYKELIKRKEYIKEKLDEALEKIRIN